MPALQAILFGRPDLTLFGSPQVQAALVEHLVRVAELAAAFGAGVLVFGSPRNRDRGTLAPDAADDIAADVFGRAAEASERLGVCLCLEPNPPAYGCNYLTRWREAAALVRRVDRPGLGLHLDVACLAMAGDDAGEALAASRDIVRHFHVTEPELGDFLAPKLDHARLGAAVHATGYDGWLSIEMRRPADPARSVADAVDKVKRWYGK